MSPRRLILMVLLLILPLSLPAQEAGEQGEEPGEEAAPRAQDAASSSVIEYMRAEFRDPFRSLKERLLEDEGPRPDGPPGMLIEEIDVIGMLTGPKGTMVLIMGSDGLGYALTEGAKLYDGVTLRVDAAEGVVVFRQDVHDPNRIKPYRDITRRLDAGS